MTVRHASWALILLVLGVQSFGQPGRAASSPVSVWFQAGRCPAFNGPYGRDAPVAGTKGDEHIEWMNHISKPVRMGGSAAYLYDPKSGAAFRHIGGDSFGSMTLRKIGPPPAGVERANLAAVVTTSGIALGTAAASVVAKLGRPLIVSGCGLQRYVYTIDPEVGNSLEFTIKQSRVVEIYQSYGD
jgi:hypothetical protein